ncbi:MAG: hypothetical protein PUC37_08870 [Spirochaetales bacterium]|nr:hypothetical protein [Spirochaetales bacterium]
MKKLIILLCFISSFFLFSCASKPEVEEQNEIDNTEIINSDAEEQDEIENTETQSSEAEDDDVIFLDDEEETSAAFDDYDSEESQDSDSLYPIPQDFEEPLVLTLDIPPEEEETDFDEPEESNAEIIEFDEDDLKLLANEDAASEENEVENTEAEAEQNLEDEETEQNLENEEADDELTAFDTIEDNDDVIDIESDEFLDEEDDKSISAENEEVPVPSRKVTLKKNEYVEITYPGTGWIFLGLTDGSRDIAYYGTKLGSKDTTFSLQARKSGTKILHFYKSDALTNEYLDDYVEVEVTNENGSNKTHIIAPEFKMPVPQIKKIVPAEPESEDNENSNSQPASDKVSQVQNSNQTSAEEIKAETEISSVEKNFSAENSQETSSATSDNLSTKVENSGTNTTINNANNSQTLLQEANILYNEKEFEAAKNKLNQYLLNPDSEIDRAYFLLGQVLEAKSSVQDIKAAINAYTNVTKNYPASKYWEDANKRIIYLKRFYLEAR